MDAMQALKAAADASNTPLMHIGRAMGKTPNYASMAIGRGYDARASTLAAMADACGYRLALIPSSGVPEGALLIDPAE